MVYNPLYSRKIQSQYKGTRFHGELPSKKVNEVPSLNELHAKRLLKAKTSDDKKARKAANQEKYRYAHLLKSERDALNDFEHNLSSVKQRIHRYKPFRYKLDKNPIYTYKAYKLPEQIKSITNKTVIYQ